MMKLNTREISLELWLLRRVIFDSPNNFAHVALVLINNLVIDMSP